MSVLNSAGARTTVNKLRNAYGEWRLNISTRGAVEVDYPDAGRYATMDYPAIRRVLTRLDLGPDDVFVDIGSGRGRVVCCAARLPVARVLGVDITERFCADATANIARMRGRRAPVEVHNVAAQDFDYSAGTAFYLFSPFGPATLDAVLDKIYKDRAGLPVRFAYVNPAHPEPFARQSWLEEYDHWDKARTGEAHSVRYFRSRW
jgi:cyclopropane fatty-acyl-phospholipid synthase-like methyltransferase